MYYTGRHELSLSAQLREAQHNGDLASLIPDDDRVLFPQLYVDSTWPPTFLVHGADDSAVPMAESQHMQQLLEDVGVRAKLEVVGGQEHSFDKAEWAEEMFGSPGGLFDEVVAFLVETLRVPEA